MNKFLLLSIMIVAACAPATTATPGPTSTPLRVDYTPGAQSWLPALTTCAGNTPVITDQRAVNYFSPEADLYLRLGQPANLTMPAFQVGTDGLYAIVNIKNPLGGLTIDQLRGLFSGQIAKWDGIPNSVTGDVHVWVFSPDDEVQETFVQSALVGGPVTSQARLATSPQAMLTAIGSDLNGIGILTSHWQAGNVHSVFNAGSLPVLAMTPKEPQGEVKDLIACMQKQ